MLKTFFWLIRTERADETNELKIAMNDCSQECRSRKEMNDAASFIATDPTGSCPASAPSGARAWLRGG